jgi:hypothetical protein
MMGEFDPQRSMFYNLSLGSFVPTEHPLRRIRPFVDDRSIRRICRPLYSSIGRPSIPLEQLFLALLGWGGICWGSRGNASSSWSCNATWPCAGS